jgi:hypothetical protein
LGSNLFIGLSLKGLSYRRIVLKAMGDPLKTDFFTFFGPIRKLIPKFETALGLSPPSHLIMGSAEGRARVSRKGALRLSFSIVIGLDCVTLFRGGIRTRDSINLDMKLLRLTMYSSFRTGRSRFDKKQVWNLLWMGFLFVYVFQMVRLLGLATR